MRSLKREMKKTVLCRFVEKKGANARGDAKKKTYLALSAKSEAAVQCC